VQLRRRLIASSVGFAVYALLGEARVFAESARKTTVRTWIGRQEELARGLASGRVSQIEWHDAVNALAGEVDLENVAQELRRAKSKPGGAPFGHDPQKRVITFIDEQGNAERLRYGVALFTFGENSVITPHAHRHMASAHMVIEGRVRIRTFDRVGDEQGSLIIRPTADVVADPGHAAAMTTAKDNIHWFTPKSRRATTLDVIVDGLDPGQRPYEIQPIDPLGGLPLPDGTIRAPLVSFERSMRLYTARS
jgi:PCO_ADO